MSMKGIYFVGYIKTKEQKLLKSAKAIKNAVLNVCKSIELNIVGEKYHVFKNADGLTYCFILSQSHFVIHTWPEENRVFFDIFTCGKEFGREKFVYILSKEFKGKVKEITKVKYR